MLTRLFSSSARVKVLGLFMLNPAQRFYLREVAAALSLPVQAVNRETDRLAKIGLLRRTANGNRVYFQADAQHFLFPEIKRIFLKTLGAQALLGDALRASPEIEAAFVYGSYAAGEEGAESDVDLFVIGNVSPRKLSAALAGFRDQTRREVNPYVTTAEEYRAGLKRRDGFLQNVLASPRIFIVGDENALQQIGA